jgi:2-amino-4-hydroxy-6-hydroxymethyldihydropteridine diphosphokinase
VDRVVAIAVGSNLGDRSAHLAFARDYLGRLLADLRFSNPIETAPVGAPDEQPSYLNAAAVGRTALPAHALIEALQQAEQARGRERTFRNAARTLDLDLILAGDEVIDEPDLVVPHPRFRERRFVLEPLAAIAPDLRDPVTGLTIVQLLNDLRRVRLSASARP